MPLEYLTPAVECPLTDAEIDEIKIIVSEPVFKTYNYLEFARAVARATALKLSKQRQT